MNTDDDHWHWWEICIVVAVFVLIYIAIFGGSYYLFGLNGELGAGIVLFWIDIHGVFREQVRAIERLRSDWMTFMKLLKKQLM